MNAHQHRIAGRAHIRANSLSVGVAVARNGREFGTIASMGPRLAVVKRNTKKGEKTLVAVRSIIPVA